MKKSEDIYTMNKFSGQRSCSHNVTASFWPVIRLCTRGGSGRSLGSGGRNETLLVSLGGGGGRGRSLVPAAVVDASLVLKVVVTVLTNPDRRRDLQPFDLRLEATAPAQPGDQVEVQGQPGPSEPDPEPETFGRPHLWQKSCPQFLQWWRRSVREKRTPQPEQLSPPSSFTQWSAAERPGWSLTDQLKTRPRPSPTRILLWSLQVTVMHQR